MRFAILFTISEHDSISDFEVMEKISPVYRGERQFNRRTIWGHLDALRAAGLIEEVTTILDQNSEITTSYTITQRGRQRLRFLPACFPRTAPMKG